MDSGTGPPRRVVLDHCVPRQPARPLAGDPPEFDVVRAGALGLAHWDDGPLLDRLAGACAVFVTVLLRARSNAPAALLPLLPRAREAAAAVDPGQLIVIAA